MKRFVALLAAVCVLAGTGAVFAGLDSVPHVMIGGLLKISGASKNVGLGDINDKGETEEDEGFDVKESARQLFSTTINPAEAARRAREDKSFEAQNFMNLIKGETMPDEDFLLSSLLSYPEFNDKVWADMKFRSIAEPRSTFLLPKGRLAAKPASANTVPSAKNGLLNPRDPIEIVTFGDSITLGFDFQVVGDYTARLLDSKGREIGELEASGREDNSTEIAIHDDGDYYLEFSDRIGKTRKYCYIFMKIAKDPIKPAEDTTITGAINQMRAAGMKGEKIAGDYMSRKGITDTDQLTEQDKQAIADEYTKSEMASAPESQRQHVMSQMEVIQQYMKERGIPSMAFLTEKDQKELTRRVMNNAALSWPPEVKAAIDDYMKKRNIKGYGDLTEKDTKAIEKLVKQKEAEMKKSAAPKKATTKKRNTK